MVNRKSRTCLDRGLVTIQDAELTLAVRVMLGAFPSRVSLLVQSRLAGRHKKAHRFNGG